jgi:hypothetical protein
MGAAAVKPAMQDPANKPPGNPPDELDNCEIVQLDRYLAP